jgi:hypothetical protein
VVAAGAFLLFLALGFFLLAEEVAFFEVGEEAEEGGHSRLQAMLMVVNSGEGGGGVGEEVLGDGLGVGILNSEL